MSEPLSHKFMVSLDGARDRVYSLALARESTAVKAEAALQRLVRGLFIEFTKSADFEPVVVLEERLVSESNSVPGNVAVLSSMPADVWARLSAAVQLEAAKSAHSTALNPDSVLLSPDPLLAPKKASVLDDSEAFDLSPPSRFVLASAIAILVGVALTIYILSRPAAVHATTQPTTAGEVGQGGRP